MEHSDFADIKITLVLVSFEPFTDEVINNFSINNND